MVQIIKCEFPLSTWKYMQASHTRLKSHHLLEFALNKTVILAQNLQKYE